MQALAASEKKGESVGDLSLYNRIGDIHLRSGDQNKAVEMYERAIDRYAEQDLHSSAIALCNKVLRVLPSRSSVHRKLGQLQLSTGLLAEARVNFLRYATEVVETDADAGLDAMEEFAVATGDPEMVARFADELATAVSPDLALGRLRALRDSLAAGGRDTSELDLRLDEFGDQPGETAVSANAETIPQREPVSMADLEDELELLAPEVEPAVVVPEELTAPFETAGELDQLEPSQTTFADLEAELDAALDVDYAFAPPAPAQDPIVQDSEAATPSDTDEPEPAIEVEEAVEVEAVSTPAEPYDPVYVASQRDLVDGLVELEPAALADLSLRPEDSELSMAARLHSALLGAPFVSDEPDPPLAGGSVESHVPGRRSPPEQLERATAASPLASPAHSAAYARVEAREPASPPGQERPTRRAAGQPEGSEAQACTEPALAATPRRVFDADPAELLITSAAARAGLPVKGAVGRLLSIEPLEASEPGSTPRLEPVLGLKTLLPEVWEGPVNGGATLEELVASSRHMAVDVGSPATDVITPSALPDLTADLPRPTANAWQFGPGDLDSHKRPANGVLRSYLEAERPESTARPESAGSVQRPTWAREPIEAAGATIPAPTQKPAIPVLDPAERISGPIASAAPASPSLPLLEVTESARSLLPVPAAHADHPAELAEPILPDTLAVHYERGLDLREAGDLAAAVDEFGLALGSPAEFAGAAQQLLECRSLLAELASTELASAEPVPVVDEPRAATAAEPEEPVAAEFSYSSALQEDTAAELAEVEAGVSALSPESVQAATPDPVEPDRPFGEVDEAFCQFVSTAPPHLLPRVLEELEDRSELNKALLVVDRLIELNGPDPVLYGTRARCAMEAGDTDLAAQTYMQLGAWLEAQADAEGACAAYRELLSVLPGHGPALAALTKVQGDAESSATERLSRDPMLESRSVTAGANRGSMSPASQAGSGPVAVPTSPSPPPSLSPGPDRTDSDDLRPYGGLAGGAEGSLDFDALINEFKAQLAEGGEEADTRTRTELGASLKDMGMLDDAIRELQAAIREPGAEPVAYELLGEAFIEKGQPRVAARILEQSLEKVTAGDRELLGVLYQLGTAYQQVNERSSALECYERIFSIDIDYRDVQDRIAACSG
jgi:tetratricopeptide (TPR) repeat protein